MYYHDEEAFLCSECVVKDLQLLPGARYQWNWELWSFSCPRSCSFSEIHQSWAVPKVSADPHAATWVNMWQNVAVIYSALIYWNVSLRFIRPCRATEPELGWKRQRGKHLGRSWSSTGFWSPVLQSLWTPNQVKHLKHAELLTNTPRCLKAQICEEWQEALKFSSPLFCYQGAAKHFYYFYEGKDQTRGFECERVFVWSKLIQQSPLVLAVPTSKGSACSGDRGWDIFKSSSADLLWLSALATFSFLLIWAFS